MFDRFVCFILLAAVGLPLANAAAGSGEACGQLDNASERLICYDKIFRPSTAVSDADAAMQQQEREAERVPVETQSERRVQLTRSQTETEDKPEQIIVSSIPATVDGVPIGEAYFGKYNYEIPQSVRVRKISAIIADQRKLWPDKRVEYTLANGQRWRQTRTQRVTIRDGDAVTIRSGRLGGYMMTNARGASAKVKRAD